MGKRASNAGLDPVTKKTGTGPVSKKCKIVVEALAEEATADVSTMLHESIPLALCVVREDRHDYQNRVVEAVGNELKKSESNLENIVAGEVAKVTAAADGKGNREAAVATAETTLNSLQEAFSEGKKKLADCARVFQAKKKELAQTIKVQEEKTADIVQAESRKMSIETDLNDVFKPLKAGDLGTSGNVKKKVTGLMGRLSQFIHLDESLVGSMPSVLSKGLSERGNFDNMAVQKLENDMVTYIAELERTIAEAEPTRAKCLADVKAAQDEFDKAKTAQIECAEEYSIAKANKEKGEEAVIAAKKEVKQKTSEYSKIVKVKDQREADLLAFREGPYAAFRELAERTERVENGTPGTDVEMAATANVSNSPSK